MALIHCDFFSEILGQAVTMTVILPQPALKPRGAARPRPWRTLYLLHGRSDDHTTWTRRTSIERYVAGLGLAVVMPPAGKSYYADMAAGGRYWTFVSEEVPAVARALFPLSDRRADNFVTGNSMGGFGAFKLALTFPERFAAAASLSGRLDLARAVAHGAPDWLADARLIFGPEARLAGTAHDLFHLAKQMAESGQAAPKLYQWCGQDDYLYEDNTAFRDHALAVGLPLTYEEGPGGHEWSEWDKQIQRVLAWLPRPRRPVAGLLAR